LESAESQATLLTGRNYRIVIHQVSIAWTFRHLLEPRIGRRIGRPAFRERNGLTTAQEKLAPNKPGYGSLLDWNVGPNGSKGPNRTSASTRKSVQLGIEILRSRPANRELSRNVSAVSDAPVWRLRWHLFLWGARSIQPFEGSRSRGGRGSMGIECGRKRDAAEVIALSGCESGSEPHQRAVGRACRVVKRRV